jgi:hypothetical protein
MWSLLVGVYGRIKPELLNSKGLSVESICIKRKMEITQPMGAQFWWMFVFPLQNVSIIYVALSD